jgi:fructose-bisphosphate aldolase class I
MDKEALKIIAQQLMSEDKGLIAMDESIPTCNKRFEENGIPQTEEYRRNTDNLSSLLLN